MRCKISIGAGDTLGAVLRLLLGDVPDAEVVSLGRAPEDLSGSQIVVLDAWSPDLAGDLAVRAPDAVLVVATADEQEACRGLLEGTRFPRQRIVGAAGAHAVARLRALVAAETGTAQRDVTGLVVGGAGGRWLPVVSTIGVAGIPIGRRLGPERLEALAAEVRDAGPPGSVELAAAVRDVVAAVAGDEHRILSASACCQGEFGIERDVTGVPVRLGRNGIEEIVDIALEAHEREALHAPAA